MKGRSVYALLFLSALTSLVCSSCATDEPKRRKRVPPSVSDVSPQPWNRPPKWEGTARYGSMMPQSR